MNLQIKTIYKLQLIQNKKTNTTYLEDMKTKPDSSNPLHELLQLQFSKWNALIPLETAWRTIQMRKPRGPNFNKQGRVRAPVMAWEGMRTCPCPYA